VSTPSAEHDATRRLPLEPTARPDEGVVSFNVNTACNYRCSYCTQRFKEDRGRWARDTPRFLAAFARLPGRWEIKISGGEPFVHPTLDELVAGLAGLGHRVGVVSNFSASREKLSRFVEAARGRVSVFSCSLHLEYVSELDAFIDKAVWLEKELLAARDASLPKPSLHVTSVATRARLPELEALRARFDDAGIRFKVQPEKQDRDVIAYSDDERAQLIALGGHNLTGEIEHRYEGRPCWAGSRYFILDDEGRAYRCYPARRYRIESLGDFLSEAFRLADQPSPCLYRTCNCTVPIARNMMPRSELGPAVLEDA
jgi:organic radical activating enzyme